MAELNLQVSASGDDNHEASNGNTNALTSPNLRLEGPFPYVGIMFRGAGSIQGETISEAILSLHGYVSGGLSIIGNIYAEDSDEPDNLSSAIGYDISNRTPTTASISVNETLSDSAYTEIDITSVIQELADRAGFSGIILIILQYSAPPDTVGNISAYDYSSGTQAAKLDITYGSGDPVVFTPKTTWFS